MKAKTRNLIRRIMSCAASFALVLAINIISIPLMIYGTHKETTHCARLSNLEIIIL